ncbi:MAG: bifunctional hydroxymethylpyrimidine kinase/phosphomethylpyrimidine kinase [Acidobacteriota bacterium]|nr:bifunctional hydroxymethylpyrimidine kinase/phosphomethylpyrimidine kinase [Acidobacteriota bacterium]
MRTVLTIAGSDSGGGAGIQADVKTFAAYGLHGATAVTAVTAQNTREVTAVQPVDASVVSAQIGVVLADYDVRVIKTGMLATAAIIRGIADALANHPIRPIVVDPVLVATSGRGLLDDDGVELMKSQLLPLAQVATPNRFEAEVLADRPIATLDDARQATARIRSLGVASVVITGGHFDGPDIVDLLDDGQHYTELRGPRLHAENTHGTGCTFAAAVAAGLALDRPLIEAVRDAKHYVEGAIHRSVRFGDDWAGLRHFWRNEQQ